MAVYLVVTAKARIKIQDPYDEKTIEDAKESTFLTSGYELVDEECRFEVEDAD